MKKRILFATSSVFLACIAFAGFYLNSLLPIITGYSAKYLCSAVFISNRNPGEVESVDLDFSFIRYVTNDINYRDKSVTSHFLWGESTAVFRPGYGCTLLRGVTESEWRQKHPHSIPKADYNQDTMHWPLGNVIPDVKTGINKRALAEISDKLMVYRTYHGNAFAFLVVHKGIPVAECYRKGFNAKTRFLSWSMAKSFTNAIAGIMVKEGLLNIYTTTGIPQWQNDARNKITINDLMQMQSGLRWNEEYGNRSDVTLMLYNNKDYAGFAINQPLESPVGTIWYYSSGSTNIVNYLMRMKFQSDSEYYAYPYSRLFNKIGMPDAAFDTDPTGNLVGSSYLYATARDYARFGMLYLQDGIFNGERILPEGWVRHTTSPASKSHGHYGSSFWLNKGKYLSSAPVDMYSCNGHDGQRIFIIPSQDLVVVVLGYSPKSKNEMHFNQLLKDILNTLPVQQPTD